MSFSYDTTGIAENDSGGFTPLAEGDYTFYIKSTEEKKSKAGNDMVVVTLVVAYGKMKGKSLRHYVTFLPPDNKGASIAKHWLKTIGQPYEGMVKVNPLAWRNIQLKGTVSHEIKDGKTFAKLAKFSSDSSDTAQEPEEVVAGTPTESTKDVPF